MKNSKKLLRLTVFAILVALGVVISPILRVEGMCPMAHFINIICSVLLGPWCSLLCALTIGIIRMSLMGIPPIALTGAIFGAFLSGVFYRISKGNLLVAVLGEVFGTGIIGAVLSYPVMTMFWGKEGISWVFYIPSFVCGTLIGGSIAFAFLKKLSNSGMLKKFQTALASRVYDDRTGLVGNTLAIASGGVICFTVIGVLKNMFSLSSAIWTYVSYILLVGFLLGAVTCFVLKKAGNKNA
ncbi:MAG: energy coupling factor transporter S component ThiW [Oscillospiraceae bacterium]|nr:energy coupling factor transporter S component ThiW [Oscillospiraceae bacterium]